MKTELTQVEMHIRLARAQVLGPHWHAWLTPTLGNISLEQCEVSTHPQLPKMRTQVPFNGAVPAQHNPAGYEHAPRVIAFGCN